MTLAGGGGVRAPGRGDALVLASTGCFAAFVVLFALAGHPERLGRAAGRIEELIRTPVALVSTSPEREDTILVTDPFAD